MSDDTDAIDETNRDAAIPQADAEAKPNRSARAERRALARRRGETGGHGEAGAGGETSQVAVLFELERRISAVWEVVLQRGEPGIDDNFFEVGGDSLLLAQVHLRLKDAFGDVTLVELLQHPTIASLARHLAATGGARRLPETGATHAPGANVRWQQNEAMERQRSFMQQRRIMRQDKSEQ